MPKISALNQILPSSQVNNDDTLNTDFQSIRHKLLDLNKTRIKTDKCLLFYIFFKHNNEENNIGSRLVLDHNVQICRVLKKA